MPKIGELNYIQNLTSKEIAHAVNKPFSDRKRAQYLSEIAAVLSLLPPPPSKLLDLGCGTGWTSLFFARCGYDVVGVDLAPDMIALAEQTRLKEQLHNVRFLVSDYEALSFQEDFDAVVFYDSLHHAVEEQLAVVRAYQALRRGGRCVTSEPGAGHHESDAARSAMRRFDVTEKDMEPARIINLGQNAGFTSFRVYPHSWDNQVVDYREDTPFLHPSLPRGFFKRAFHAVVRRILRMQPLAYEAMMGKVRSRVNCLVDFHHAGGIVCMVK